MQQCLNWYVSYDIGLKKEAKTAKAWYRGTLSKVPLRPLYQASTIKHVNIGIITSYLLETPNDAYTILSQLWLAVQQAGISTAAGGFIFLKAKRGFGQGILNWLKHSNMVQ